MEQCTNKNIIYIEDIKKEVEKNLELFIDSCEKNFEKQIVSAADNILKFLKSSKEHNKSMNSDENGNGKEGKNRIVLISGPSSSGKTTTASLIKDKLKEKDIKSVTVSLDDFYLPKEKLPVLQNGKFDYESVNCLDLDKINKCLEELICGGYAKIPVFDFKKSRPVGYNPLFIDSGTIIIVEGIHALNPKVVSGKLNTFKIYISAKTEFWDDNVVITTKNLRFIRRIIRDFHTRGASVMKTVSLWDNVCAGEEKYIKPFMNMADMTIDSVHAYEPMIYAECINEILFQNSSNTSVKSNFDLEYRYAIDNITHILGKFGKINKQLIPKVSLVNEFLGINAE